MTRLPVHLGVPVVAAGGVLGALARLAVSDAWPQPFPDFPWTVLVINVVGSALLAALPAFAVVRRSTWLPLFLGTGVLGGFTTMSTASTQAAELLDAGHGVRAFVYVAATLLAAVAAALVIDRWTTTEERAEFEAEEGDE